MNGDRLRLLGEGVLPGAMIGVGGGVLIGLLADDPARVATFVAGVGVVALALGGLSWAATGSFDTTVGDYVGDDEFDTEDARGNALRLAGLGAGLLIGGAVTVVVL